MKQTLITQHATLRQVVLFSKEIRKGGRMHSALFTCTHTRTCTYSKHTLNTHTDTHTRTHTHSLLCLSDRRIIVSVPVFAGSYPECFGAYINPGEWLTETLEVRYSCRVSTLHHLPHKLPLAAGHQIPAPLSLQPYLCLTEPLSDCISVCLTVPLSDCTSV